MKRDMELVRQVLLQIEEDRQLDGRRYKELVVNESDPKEAAYTLNMLIDAGFVTGRPSKNPDLSPMISGLSWQGHELLDDIRDTEIWRKTKERAKGLASISISVLAELAKSEIKKHLGLP